MQDPMLQNPTNFEVPQPRTGTSRLILLVGSLVVLGGVAAYQYLGAFGDFGTLVSRGKSKHKRTEQTLDAPVAAKAGRSPAPKKTTAKAPVASPKVQLVGGKTVDAGKASTSTKTKTKTKTTPGLGTIGKAGSATYWIPETRAQAALTADDVDAEVPSFFDRVTSVELKTDGATTVGVAQATVLDWSSASAAYSLENVKVTSVKDGKGRALALVADPGIAALTGTESAMMGRAMARLPFRVKGKLETLGAIAGTVTKVTMRLTSKGTRKLPHLGKAVAKRETFKEQGIQAQLLGAVRTSTSVQLTFDVKRTKTTSITASSYGDMLSRRMTLTGKGGEQWRRNGNGAQCHGEACTINLTFSPPEGAPPGTIGDLALGVTVLGMALDRKTVPFRLRDPQLTSGQAH